MATSPFALLARALMRPRQTGTRRGALTAAQVRLLRELRPSGLGVLYVGAEDDAARDPCDPRDPSSGSRRPRRAPNDA